MKKYIFFLAIILLISLGFLASSCSNNKTIPERYYEEYKRILLESCETDSVRLEFRRPAMYIEVRVSEDIGEDDMDEIFELTKSFVTVNKMDEIKVYLKRNDPLASVYLEIMNSTDDTLYKEYVTDYFISTVNDFSPENIDGYETWWELTGDESVIPPGPETTL